MNTINNFLKHHLARKESPHNAYEAHGDNIELEQIVKDTEYRGTYWEDHGRRNFTNGLLR